MTNEFELNQPHTVSARSIDQLSGQWKNPIIELDCKISLAYIVCFKVNMSFSSTRGFNLEKCMHSIDADINACPWRPIWKTFVLW